MKKSKKWKEGDPAEQKKQKQAFVAAQLAPAEERLAFVADTSSRSQAPERGLHPPDEGFVDGSVILDDDDIRIPRHFIHPDSDHRGSQFNPVLIVVLTIALCFTAFVAYLIYLQPD